VRKTATGGKAARAWVTGREKAEQTRPGLADGTAKGKRDEKTTPPLLVKIHKSGGIFCMRGKMSND